MVKCGLLIFLLTFSLFVGAQSQQNAGNEILNLNKPERVEWFHDLGFGMLIELSFDSQLEIELSQSMLGASDAYIDRYINELPQTFNPKDFDATEIAKLAKLAGIKYIILTAKHHSGFSMWETETTDFNITNTPYGKDLLAEFVDAVREAGLAVGLYFSPVDFNFLHENGLPVKQSFNNDIPAYIMTRYQELNELQTIELMAKHGDIDILFYDGTESPLTEKCKQVAWELHPDVVITGGAMKSFRQTVPGTLGKQYKSGTQILEQLFETRAKGGNQLINVALKANGEIPDVKENLLREIAAWNFVNRAAMEATDSWIVANEENVWFTRNPDEEILYAILTNQPNWPLGERREIVLHSVDSSANMKVEVLGQSGKPVEYLPGVDTRTYFEQQKDGLHISAVRTQQLNPNKGWNNPLVLKITGAKAALVPPGIKTKEALIVEIQNGYRQLFFNGEITENGDTGKLKAGFQYREFNKNKNALNSGSWKETETVDSSSGQFTLQAPFKKTGKTYQYRAFVDHPKLRIYGDVLKITF